MITEALTKEELELIGYKGIGEIDNNIVTKWTMRVQGFWAKDDANRDMKFYISIVELHARLSMIVGYRAYCGIKPHKDEQ